MGSSSGGTLETRPGEGDQGSSQPAAPAPAGEAKPQKNQDRLVTGPAGPGSPASHVEGSMWSPGPCPLVCLIEQPPVWPHHTGGGPVGLQGWGAGLGTGILNIAQRFQAAAGLSIPGRADRASAQPGTSCAPEK